MRGKRIIAAICLALFSVMFVHSITESMHEHHHDESGFISGESHHCYDQEDELSFRDLNDFSKILEFLDVLASMSLPYLYQVDFSIEDSPVRLLRYNTGDVPIPPDAIIYQGGLRAPPTVSA